jgi:hypothetical protein
MMHLTHTHKACLSLEQQAAIVNEITVSPGIEPEEKEYKPCQKRVHKSKNAGTAGASTKARSLSTAPVKQMRKKGKLAKLQEMLLDILFEVCFCVYAIHSRWTNSDAISSD